MVFVLFFLTLVAELAMALSIYFLADFGVGGMVGFAGIILIWAAPPILASALAGTAVFGGTRKKSWYVSATVTALVTGAVATFLFAGSMLQEMWWAGLVSIPFTFAVTGVFHCWAARVRDVTPRPVDASAAVE